MEQIPLNIQYQESFCKEDATRTILFGDNATDSPKFLEQILGQKIQTVMVVFTKGSERARKVAETIKLRLAKNDASNKLTFYLFGGAWPQVPEDYVEAAVLEYNRLGQPDSILTVGGGSAVGLGKAICLRCTGGEESQEPLPYLMSVVTTYSGSEMTDLQGISRKDGSGKQVFQSSRMVVKLVVYDPGLLNTLPDNVTVPSVFNAMAHAVEVLWGQNLDEETRKVAKEAIRMICLNITDYVGGNSEVRGKARSKLLYGAYLCGHALGAGVELGIHHKLAHVLGGLIKLPHAQAHCVLLPYSIAYNRAHCDRAMSDLVEVLSEITFTGGNVSDPATTIFNLQRGVGAPCSLKDIGMQEYQIDSAVEASMHEGYSNPRPYEKRAIRKLYEMAFNGEKPDISSKY